MKHDENKIEEHIDKMSEWYEVSNTDGEVYKKPAFLPSRDCVKDAIKQYAEEMVQQEQERIVKEIEEFKEIRIEGIPIPDLRTQIIKLINDNHIINLINPKESDE